MVSTNEECKNLPTYMRNLHDYYMAQATEIEQTNFKVIISSLLVFCSPEEEKHLIGRECLFQLYQISSLDTQILMLWTM